MDEIRPPRSTWAKAPRTVSIALTNACDLACSFCYAPKRPATLNYALLQSWIREMDAEGCLGVGLGGGEPTLHPHFADLCQFAAAETRLAVTFTTHGHHLTDELLSALMGSVNYVRVSVDGVGETYERVRGRCFRTLVQQLHAVRRFSRFGINFVVNSQTVGDLHAALDIAVCVGADEFLLLPEQPTEYASGITSEARARLSEFVARYNGPVRLAVSAHDHSGLPICQPIPNETTADAYAHIDALGVLRRTSYSRLGVPIGSAGLVAALETLATRERSCQ